MRVVALDAGHGGRDPGALSPLGPPHENAIALAVTLAAGRRLAQAGLDVRYTRAEDVYLSPGERQRWARALHQSEGVAAFVSVHCNAAERPATGQETFHHPRRSSALAESVHAGVQRATPERRDRGVKAAAHAVTDHPFPACLVEVEFIHTEAGARWLADPVVQAALAVGIAGGVAGFLGVALPAPVPAADGGDPVGAVVSAWVVTGPSPEVHLRAQEALRRDWPVLGQALDALATASSMREGI